MPSLASLRRHHRLSNVAAEMIGTFILLLGILALGGNVIVDGVNPILVGLLVAVIGMSLGGLTGYAINPTRDLGPRIAHFLLSNWSYAWVPIVGPIIGGVFGALFYKQFFLQEPSIMFWIFAIIIFVILIGAQLTQPKVSEKGRA